MTALTLGVYSAWAKVRKTKYFYQNTRLDGNVFDYHGRPGAILRGRVVALALAAAYTWTFQFSLAAGVVTALVLCAAGPWLLMRAQVFRLSNTSYRGLRFGFRADTNTAYRVATPVLGLWFANGAATAMAAEQDGISEAWVFGATTLALLLAMPWMHHRLKAYQHAHATYGDRWFGFTPVTRRFYAVYARGLALVVAAIALGFLAIISLLILVARIGESYGSTLVAWIAGAMFGLAVYVVAWPYLTTRLQQAVWEHTHFETLRFSTAIRARPLFRLVFKSVALTLLTAGLYWPFAAVALARYRVECMRIASDQPWSMVAAGLHAGSVAATGEGAADAFGLDLGF